MRENYQNTKTPKKPALSTVALGVFLSLLGVCLGILLCLLPHLRGKRGQTEAEISVPQLLGTQPNLAALAEDFSCTLHYVFRADLAEGSVVSQSPNAGVSRAKGDSLSLTISTQSKGVLLPDVVGEPKEPALGRLAQLGIAFKLEEVESSAPKNTILRTTPQAGETVYAPQCVTLFISCGDGMAEVPNVVGMSHSDAVFTLERAGFFVGKTDFALHILQPGTVLSQSISAGVRKPLGTQIDLVVSTKEP